MKISANLWKNRHGTWYFRVVIPQDLRQYFPNHRREIRRSLHTDSKQHAVRLARLYRVEFEQLLADLISYSKKSACPSAPESSELLHVVASKIQEELKEMRCSISTLSSPTKTTPLNGPPLSRIVDEFCSEQVQAGNWKLKTEQENRAIYKLLLVITDDPLITEIDYSTIRNYKATLQCLPPNMNKVQRYRNMSINEILALNNVKPMSTTTINKNLIRASSLFTWAAKQGYISQNFAQGFTIKTKRRADQQRDTFTLEELQALFNGSIYMGNFPRGSHCHSYQFWLPLLGLYTGARIEELCKLHLEEIFQIDSIWCLQIKNAKTPSGERLIPIHKQLVELGFINHILKQKQREDVRLFPELRKDRDGYSQAASKWFRRYRERCGVGGRDRRKCFHSFRHTVIDNLKQRGDLPRDQIAAIVGHRKNDVTLDRYGKPYHPSILAKVVNFISYQELDLSHINFQATHAFFKA